METTNQPILETDTRLMPLYRTIIHNDDVNSFDHVIRSVSEVFRFTVEQSVMITIEAHETGCALCKVEPLEAAEFHVEQLQSAGLTASYEPEE